jgi:hypothetical protein
LCEVPQQAQAVDEVITGNFFAPTKPLEDSFQAKGQKQNTRYKPKPISCSTKDSSLSSVSVLSGIGGERYRWTKGFFVQADTSFTKREMRLINDAMYELHKVLCIPVNMWTRNSRPVGDYAFIKKGGRGTGCYAQIGRLGGRQIINLETGRCLNKATIIHEAIHALGFNHEQTRPDRDDYINIYWRNIIPGLEFNFKKFRGALTYNIPYDFNSIMHYDGYAFSRNGRPTIVGKNGERIGFNSLLSPHDIQRLRAMYNCNDPEVPVEVTKPEEEVTTTTTETVAVTKPAEEEVTSTEPEEGSIGNKTKTAPKCQST